MQREVGSSRARPRRAGQAVLVALAVVATLLAVDLLTSLFYRTDTTMSISRSGPQGGSDHTLVVFPGYAGDCDSVSQALGPHLPQSWNLVVLCYAERGVDDDQVFALIGAEIEGAPAGSVSILAGSMGGMIAARFLDRLARSGQDTDLEVRLFLDTSPPDSIYLKRPESLLKLTHWYRGGALTSFLWWIANRSSDHSALEPGASLEVVEDGDRYFRQIGMPALTSQAQYIDSFRLADAPYFQSLVSHAVFIKAANAADDPLVEVDRSIEAWRIRLPGLQTVELTSRQGDWHVPWNLRPKEVVSVVLDE